MSANNSTTYVQTPAAARLIAAVLGKAASVALDCEAAGFHRYSDRLCLIQLSTLRETFVLDPLAFDPTPFIKPILEDPERVVLMHGAGYDLRLLTRDLGIGVANLTDTQVAASLVGEPAVGLQALLERHLGVRVSKKFQRADWAMRPLTREMIDYAAGDTRHLHRLAALLDTALRAKGRLHWAEEENRWLVESASGTDHEVVPDPVTRVRGAWKMDDRAVTALREAIEWRDRIARARDRAPFRIASDAALMEAIARRPASVSGLAALKGFPRHLAKRHGRSLLDALARVDRLPTAKLTPYPRSARRSSRPTPEEEAAFMRLKDARNGAAARLGLERGLVTPNHVLRRIVAARPQSQEALTTAVSDMRHWQAEAIGKDLLAALRSA